ncbi:MAG: response regulator transcription factor [Gemmatirosa sp.]|nr:response regulator transcription factor [Gemmatirosa sp.]
MHVLLAEVDADVRAQLAEVLERAGHEVTAVADGEAALAVIERAHPPLVIVADDLPGLTGLQVCRRVRSMERDGATTFVLVLTAERGGGELAATIDAGADDFMFLLRSGPRTNLPARLGARIGIAERRIAEDAARRRAEAALARAQRLVGIGETSIALQHEINNPLAALLGHAALLEHGLYDPGEERDLLAVIVEQAHRIADVVKRISALRNPDSVEYVRGGERMLDLSEDGSSDA